MIQFDHLTYRYPGSAEPALRDVSLSINAGEVVLVTGPSGGGKSTLLRALNGLVPHFTGGKISGHVLVAGHDPIKDGPARMSRIVGMVFQEPESQFAVDVVEDEIAFALENSGVPRAEMRARVEAALAQLNIAHLRSRAIHTLSGGEQQRVAIASALVMQPRVLVLDEPTSQLDDDSANDVLEAVAMLNRDLGLTVVISEHRLERVLPFASRAIRLEAGALTDESGRTSHKSRPRSRFPKRETERGSREVMSHESPASHSTNYLPITQLLVTDLHAGYGNTDILRGASLHVHAGEIVALMGRNGSGKTTLLRCIVGLMQPRAGEIAINVRSVLGRETADIARDVAYLPQNPNALLFADTVTDELNITRKNHALAPFAASDAASMLGQLGIARYADAYPRDLSVGERQRAALGAVVAARPKLLLLDEPTRGLDAESKRKLADVLRGFANDSAGVLLVTHDHMLVAMCADRVVRLVDGEILLEERL